MNVCQYFSNDDLLVYLELARTAMADADTFDEIAEEMDLSDEEMQGLRENLHNYRNDTEK